MEYIFKSTLSVRSHPVLFPGVSFEPNEFEFATYIFVSLPFDKVQNLHPRRVKLK